MKYQMMKILSAVGLVSAMTAGGSEAVSRSVDHDSLQASIRVLQDAFDHSNNAASIAAAAQSHRDHHNDYRQLQDFGDLPPPFVPTRECNAVFGTLTVDEVAALADVYLLALFPPGSPNESLLGLAQQVLLSQVQYNVTLAKVCMSCAEARNLLTLDQANNEEDKYGFANYCSEGMFGADNVQQSALVMIPQEPGTDQLVLGEVRGSVSIRATIPDLYSSPSALFPSDMTEYLLQTPLEEAIPEMSQFLVGVVYASSGAIVAMPDLVGYGESYETPRSYFSIFNAAQGTILAWLATQEFVNEASNGCTALEATATVNGYSEGGTAVIPGALALEQIGVAIHSAYPGGAVWQPTLQFAFIFEVFAPDAPPLDASSLASWKIFLPMISYTSSIDNDLLPNTGSGQLMVSEAYSQGDIETNVFDWFNPPGQLSVNSAYAQFAPDITTDILNQNLKAIYDEARGLGEPDACSNFVSDTTDVLCAAILGADLIPDLENLVGFPTIVCHSPEDDIVAFDQVPTFPFEANPLVTEYDGIGDLVPPTGSHGVAGILCAVSPISALQSGAGESSPVFISPLPNEAECREQSPGPTPSPDDTPTTSPPTTSPPTPSPVDTPTAAPSGSLAATGIRSALLFAGALVAVLL